MATIAENLQKIIEIKADIKSAIKGKGVEVSDSDKFETYPSLISSIPQEGGGGGDCDEEHYMEYEWVTNGVTRCYGDDLGVQYVPELTYKGEKYSLNNTPTKVEIEEEDNYDCKCHQLLVETIDGNTTNIRINGTTTSFTISSGEPYMVENSEDWTSLLYFFNNSRNIKKILRFPLCPNISDAGAFLQYPEGLEDFSGLKGLITNKCTNLNNNFTTIPLIENFDTHLLEWDTSSVTDFRNWFLNKNSASRMKRIDMTGFSYASVTDGANMIRISNLPDVLDEAIIGNFTLSSNSSVYALSGSGNETIERIVFKNIDWTSTNTTGSMYTFYSNSMFKNASYLEWDNVKIKTLATSSSFNWSFPLGTSFTNLKGLNFNNVVIEVPYVSYFFYQIPLTTLDVSGVDVSNIKKFTSTFSSCNNLEELNLSGWNLDNSDFGDSSQFSSTDNLKVIYVCGCSETTKQKILDAINRNFSLKDKVQLLSKTKTGEWRWSSDIDTFCENQQLYSVHYKEYEWSCDAEEAEWRKDYNDYQIISVTDSDECKSFISVVLNNEWQPLTENVSAPDNMDGTIFESFSNCVIKGNKYGDAKIRIKFKNSPDFKIWIKSETNNQDIRYDYTVASKLDTEITKTQPAYSDSNIQYYTYNVAANPWVECDYSNDGREHFIDIVYRNDSSGNYGLDKGFVFIPYEDVTIE